DDRCRRWSPASCSATRSWFPRDWSAPARGWAESRARVRRPARSPCGTCSHPSRHGGAGNRGAEARLGPSPAPPSLYGKQPELLHIGAESLAPFLVAPTPGLGPPPILAAEVPPSSEYTHDDAADLDREDPGSSRRPGRGSTG